MRSHTVIFIGRSGCGKGTQAKLLMEHLTREDPHRPIEYIETGKRFRSFIEDEGYTNKLSKVIYNRGGRQPDFLAVWMWSHLFMETLSGNEHIFIDGAPRSLLEAQILDTALSFYGRTKPLIIHLNVSRKWSEKHLMSRGRSDDIDLALIKRRLDWFEEDVVPAVEYYSNHPGYHFMEVDGEQGIDNVHNEIVENLEK
ncbi:nucleoside monophosphate kinase [Candidatus Parcubacteria bacterium]|nr:nucleoside monophosphate kinase [Candidatus Parcubacteria bacterium]